ncbi:MAG TPA: response regulator [Rhodocyclaceae bacterium]|nr:response regulator transcription factor [Betaproteobacteria bacterium]HMV01100.1 response regulator [Rhodocyclaceae bacterium]HMV20654.1 response regulator [Rhodocyclaceae bacterium]HMW76623.1 response regulator [Rhodocyclaceae bacterium]HNE42116.1 response regulator [Rhodocyclaceae bacterium]
MSLTDPVASPSPIPVVYVVDDDPVARKSVSFLVGILDVEVCPLESAESFLAAYRPGLPNCLILDVRMPGMSGMELQSELLRRQIDIPIIFVSGHGDIPMAVRAMQSGALDFLTKPYSDQDLLERVQKALRLDVERKQRRRQQAAVRARLALLTQREVDVLQLVVKGMTNKEIAQSLTISVKTVETHRARVMEKMRAESLAGLCAAIQAAQQPA